MFDDAVLEKLKENFPVTSSSLQVFFPANDVGCLEVLSQATTVFEKSIQNVAMVVGHSYISALLYLIEKISGASFLVVCDVNPRLLEIVQFEIDTLKEASTFEAFQNIFLNFHPVRLELGERFSKSLSQYSKAVNGKTPWQSEEIFDLNRKAALEITLVGVPINLFDASQIEKFNQILKASDLKITFANLTNVGSYQWDEENLLYKSGLLQMSSFHTTPYIMSAQHPVVGLDGMASTYKAELYQLTLEGYVEHIYRKEMVMDLLYEYSERELLQALQENPVREVPIHHAPLKKHGFNLFELALLNGSRGSFKTFIIDSMLLIGGTFSPEFLHRLSQMKPKEVTSRLDNVEFFQQRGEWFVNILERLKSVGGMHFFEATKNTYTSILLGAIGENSMVVCEGDTFIFEVHKNSKIFIKNGNLYATKVHDGAYLEANSDENHEKGNVYINYIVPSSPRPKISIFAKNNVEIFELKAAKVRVRAGGNTLFNLCHNGLFFEESKIVKNESKDEEWMKFFRNVDLASVEKKVVVDMYQRMFKSIAST